MHMIGISGRCPAERRSSSGLYPFPFDARARRGCTSISASKTGCQWCRALVSETPFTMRWAYLILVSGLPLDFVDPRLEPTDFLASDFTHMGTFRKQNLGSDGGTEDEHDDDPASGEDRHVRPDGTVSPHDEGNEYEYGQPDGACDKHDDAESLEVNPRRTDHGGPPAIWTILAFPRPTRISAIVFGSVTTSSFFSRYVVSIPANGGRSSSTWTRTWSLRLGGTVTRFVSSARTTFIRSGSFFAASGRAAEDCGIGDSARAARGDPPNASARLLPRRATMPSNRPRSWAGKFGTSTSAPLARLDASRASLRSRYVKIWSRRLRTFLSSSCNRRALGELGSFWASLFADSSSRVTYEASLS